MYTLLFRDIKFDLKNGIVTRERYAGQRDESYGQRTRN